MPLPSPSKAQNVLLGQFLRFSLVGAAGFLVDLLSVTLLRPFLGLTAATLGAYIIAGSHNWALNAVWTFRPAATDERPLHRYRRQWLRFLAANLPGFVVNRGVALAVYWLLPLSRHYPAIALAAGTGCATLLNFSLSRYLVFRN